jgi:hypothetical protein
VKRNKAIFRTISGPPIRHLEGGHGFATVPSLLAFSSMIFGAGIFADALISSSYGLVLSCYDSVNDVPSSTPESDFYLVGTDFG